MIGFFIDLCVGFVDWRVRRGWIYIEANEMIVRCNVIVL
jgi:hypothetical protein